MLPIGGIGFARVGGTGGFNITPGAISKACKMGGRLVLNGERGEGAIARHPRRGNITLRRRAERRRRDLLEVIFGFLLDHLGVIHSSLADGKLLV